jgi:hypothetical protein
MMMSAVFDHLRVVRTWCENIEFFVDRCQLLLTGIGTDDIGRLSGSGSDQTVDERTSHVAGADHTDFFVVQHGCLSPVSL